MIATGVLNEGDHPDVLIPMQENWCKKSLKVNMFVQTVVTLNFLRIKCQLQLVELGEPEYAHMSTSSVGHNFKLFFSKLSFVHELVFNLAMISYFNKHSLPVKY